MREVKFVFMAEAERDTIKDGRVKWNCEITRNIAEGEYKKTEVDREIFFHGWERGAKQLEYVQTSITKHLSPSYQVDRPDQQWDKNIEAFGVKTLEQRIPGLRSQTSRWKEYDALF